MPPDASATGDPRAALREAYDAAMADPDAFARGFYARLFALDAGLATLFGGDMTVQGRRLVEMLDQIVDAAADPAAIAGQLRALGRRHVGYGAEPQHYPLIGAALQATLAELAGERHGEEAVRSLSELFAAVSAYMLDGAMGT